MALLNVLSLVIACVSFIPFGIILSLQQCRFINNRGQPESRFSRVSLAEHNKRVLATLVIGDAVEFRRALYSHWAIYIGNEKVIHVTGIGEGGTFDSSNPSHVFSVSGKRFKKATVRIDNYFHVARGSTAAMKNNFKDTKFPRRPIKEIIETAMGMIGDTDYNVFWKNCEHFVSFCRNGTPLSGQIETARLICGIIALAFLGFIFLGKLIGRKRKTHPKIRAPPPGKNNTIPPIGKQRVNNNANVNKQGPNNPAVNNNDNGIIQGPNNPAVNNNDNGIIQGPNNPAVNNNDNGIIQGPNNPAVNNNDNGIIQGPNNPAVNNNDNVIIQGPNNPAVNNNGNGIIQGPNNPAVNNNDNGIIQGPNNTAVNNNDNGILQGPNNPAVNNKDNGEIPGPHYPVVKIIIYLDGNNPKQWVPMA